jgi:hypothetical protein
MKTPARIFVMLLSVVLFSFLCQFQSDAQYPGLRPNSNWNSPDRRINNQPYQNLYLTWVGVVDNGEGNGGIHSAEGNLHMQIYNDQGKEMEHTILTGPSKNEFLDGDEASYFKYLGPLFNGRPIRVKIWESDGAGIPGTGIDFGRFGMWLTGRQHDLLFDAWITAPALWQSGSAAARDAINNAINRGANEWAMNVWNGGVRPGIPKMFVRIESR